MVDTPELTFAPAPSQEKEMDIDVRLMDLFINYLHSNSKGNLLVEWSVPGDNQTPPLPYERQATQSPAEAIHRWLMPGQHSKGVVTLGLPLPAT